MVELRRGGFEVRPAQPPRMQDRGPGFGLAADPRKAPGLLALVPGFERLPIPRAGCHLVTAPRSGRRFVGAISTL